MKLYYSQPRLQSIWNIVSLDNWGKFVVLMLSSSLGCDPINKYEKYAFGHTLSCYLSPTEMFSKPTSYPQTLD